MQEKGLSLGIMVAKKERLPPSRHHFFFTDHSKDYFLFLNQGSASLHFIIDGKTSLLKEIKMEPIEPLKFLSTGSGDIHILHSKGVLYQNIEQIIADKPFRSITFEESRKCLNFVTTKPSCYIVVCESQLLLIIEDWKLVKTVKYPSNLEMSGILVDIQRRQQFNPRLVVPCKDLSFPLVFCDRELQKMSNQDYLSHVLKVTKKYYFKDQMFQEEPKMMSFSSTFSRIYVIMNSEILILSIKRSGMEEIDYLLGLKMRVNLKMTSLPFFVWVNTQTGALLMIGKDKVIERDPARYIFKGKISLKQKEELILAGYNIKSGQHNFVFLSSTEKNTKLRFVCSA